MTTDWECPQHGCTAPLEAHIVTRADQHHQDTLRPVEGGKQNK